MKYSNLIFSLIIISFLSCRKDNLNNFESAQHEFDFSSEWTFRYYHNYTGGAEYIYVDTTHYWFDGDTIMERFTRTDFYEAGTLSQNHQYHILRFNKRSYYNPENGGSGNETQGIKAYIREGIPNETYYITYVDTSVGVGWEYCAGNEEVLLWDFNLNEGDTMKWCRWNYPLEGDNWLMKDKDTIYAQNHQFERLKFYTTPIGTNVLTSSLVGIGSINGIDRLSPYNNLIHFHCDDFDYYP